MKKVSIQSFLVLLMLAFMITSCSEEINDGFPEQNLKTDELSEETSSVILLSLDEIIDPVLSKQLPKTKSHLQQIIATEYNHLFSEYDLDAWSITSDYVTIKKYRDVSEYTFVGAIPHASNRSLDQVIYLTMSFNANDNLINDAAFYLKEVHSLSFDKEGKMLDPEEAVTRGGGKYTPKPKLPSKPPKDVLCRFLNQNFPNGAYTIAYCGGTPGTTDYIPQWVMDIWLESMGLLPIYVFNDLYILTDPPVNPYIGDWDTESFDDFDFSVYPGLEDAIVHFYHDYMIVESPGVVVNLPDKLLTLEEHLNKQTLIDSFFQWLEELRTSNPNAHNYMVNVNPSLVAVYFSIFADFNASNPINAGVYLGVPNGENSSNPDLACLTEASESLLDPGSNALINMVHFSQGLITLQQFTANLLSVCN